MDVHDEVHQVAGSLHPIPGGFPFAADLDSLRLSSRPDQSLRHAISERGTLRSPIDDVHHMRFSSAEVEDLRKEQAVENAITPQQVLVR